MHDAIIIGGGPAGSEVARRLAENGYKVLVLEKKPRPGEKSCCTGLVGMECVATFNIDDRVILRRLNSATLFSPSGGSLRVYRPEMQAVVLDRSAFDISMAEQARRAGAEYQFMTRVTGINVTGGHAAVTVSYNNKASTIQGRAAVLAAGFTPGLSERVGLGVSKDYVIGVQVETETPGLEETEVWFGDMAPGFFGWLVPTTPGRGKVGLLARREAGRKLKKWLERLAEQGKVTSADVKLHYGAIPLKPPARTYGERIVAVGDAAGQVKPTSGGGIFYGLLGAEIAAATLNRALADDDLSRQRLAQYERAWRRKLGKEIRTGYWARQIFEKMSDKQINLMFKIIKAGGIDKALLAAPEVSFDWHGRTITSLLKYQLITKNLGIVRMPFKPKNIDPRR
ncbi:MAG: NAD(P)/FAD-dependent oxidoreductase [Dehalococcoidales bacterium]|jgi:geranylgeranyl reductase family protein